MKKILGVLVAVVLVVGLGVGIYFIANSNKKGEASAVMTLQTNPEVQLVLDKNNKVISANALNEDGEGLVLSVNFVGLSAEDAASLFAEMATQFVTNKNSSDSHFLHEVNGDLNVNITIACEDLESEKYNNLKESVKNSVNEYYKEAKIMAGAVISLTEDVKAEIEKLGYDASEYANKEYKEIMQEIQTKSEELKGVAFERRDEVFNKIDNFNSNYGDLFDLRDEYDAMKAQIQNAKEELNLLKEELKTATGLDKIRIEGEIITLETAIEANEEIFDGIISNLENLNKNYIQEYINEVSNFVSNVKEQCKTLLESKKANLQNLLEQGKNIVNSFTTEMEQKGESLITSIEQYQASLNA